MKEDRTQLDERLQTTGQLTVAIIVAALPEDQPSMVWRSSLNEALRQESKRFEKRRRLFWFARPAIGLSLAAAAAVVLFVAPFGSRGHTSAADPSIAAAQSLEAGLMDVHREEVRASDVAGVGLTPSEAAKDQSGGPFVNSSDESAADLES